LVSPLLTYQRCTAIWT